MQKPGEATRSKENPGGARRSQEEPGGAREVRATVTRVQLTRVQGTARGKARKARGVWKG